MIFLRERGYDVDTTNNGHEALEILKKRI